MMTADQRYLNDTQFKTLVDWMEKFILETQFTPSELREAAMLAAIHYEMRRPLPRMLSGLPPNELMDLHRACRTPTPEGPSQ